MVDPKVIRFLHSDASVVSYVASATRVGSLRRKKRLTERLTRQRTTHVLCSPRALAPVGDRKGSLIVYYEPRTRPADRQPLDVPFRT